MPARKAPTSRSRPTRATSRTAAASPPLPKAPRARPRARSKAGPETTFYRTCSRCGRAESCAEDGIPPGWSMSFDRRRVEFICPTCARANIRAIEGKLPEEYWE